MQVMNDRKKRKLEDWVLSHQTQFLLLAGQVAWTQACEEALRHGGSPTTALTQQAANHAGLCQQLQAMAAGELSPANRFKVGADEAHQYLEVVN